MPASCMARRNSVARLKRGFNGPKRQTLSGSICMAVSAANSSLYMTRGNWPPLRMPRSPRVCMPGVGPPNIASQCGFMARIASWT